MSVQAPSAAAAAAYSVVLAGGTLKDAGHAIGVSKSCAHRILRDAGLITPARYKTTGRPDKRPGDAAVLAVGGLKGRSCRFPLGDPTSDEFRFCCAPTEVGASYCEHHRAIAYTPRAA